MTESRKIIVNTLAAYGRSLITLPIHLFSTRWVLAGLGATDMGICNVVGGILFFITFINAILSGAASRFYAYSLGRVKAMSSEEGETEMCRLFNSILAIHILLPLLLALGYPIAAYAVRHWLVIPVDRVDTAIWVLRFSVVTAFFNFVNVPYSALFGAHQMIAQLSAYALLSAFCVFGLAAWVPHMNGDRLLTYAFVMMCIHVVSILGINTWARFRFKCARISVRLMFEGRYVLEVLRFASCKLMGGAAWMLRSQGSAVLLNVNFGPATNAAFSVGQQISGQAASFSQSLINAFTPAITSAEGSGDRRHMVDLAFRSSKFGSILILFFGVPLTIEIGYVLKLWLGDPPVQSSVFCVCMLVVFLIDKLTLGQNLALTAYGRIGRWQMLESLSLAASIPIGWGLIHLTKSPYSVGLGYIGAALLAAGGKLYCAHCQVGMSALRWGWSVVLPVLTAMLISVLPGYFTTTFMPETFGRLVVTTAVCMSALCLAAWFVVFNDSERDYVLRVITSRVPLFAHWLKDKTK